MERASKVPALYDRGRAIHAAGHVSALKELHDDIDRADEENTARSAGSGPTYQIPRLARGIDLPSGNQIEEDIVVLEPTCRPNWPADPFDQIRRVSEVLERAPARPRPTRRNLQGPPHRPPPVV